MPKNRQDSARSEKYNQIDQMIGKKIRNRRVMLGMNQDDLAKEIGVTFQQVQKYEKGVNRLFCSRLCEVANVLGVPIMYFFEETQYSAIDYSDASSIGHNKTLKIVNYLNKIEDADVQKNLFELTKAIAASSGSGNIEKRTRRGTKKLTS